MSFYATGVCDADIVGPQTRNSTQVLQHSKGGPPASRGPIMSLLGDVSNGVHDVRPGEQCNPAKTTSRNSSSVFQPPSRLLQTSALNYHLLDHLPRVPWSRCVPPPLLTITVVGLRRELCPFPRSDSTHPDEKSLLVTVKYIASIKAALYGFELPAGVSMTV